MRRNKFKSVFDFSDKNYEDNVPLNLFLNQFDFNHLHNKLKNKFKESSIKYLFYEDLKIDRVYFSNQLSTFCGLDENITQKLFNSNITNNRTIIDKKDYYVKGYVYKIIRSKFYLNLKKVPFKHYLKNLFGNIL